MDDKIEELKKIATPIDINKKMIDKWDRIEV